MATKGFLDWTLPDIIDYCKKHDAVDWLKATAKKEVAVTVYPRISVVKTREDGTTYKTTEADKSQKPHVEMRRISFVQLKTEFLEKFALMPAKKAKAATMYEIIDSL